MINNIKNTIIDSYCCIECHKCEIYMATVNNDLELKIKIAERWKNKFQKHFEPEDVQCRGCKAGDENIAHFCTNICEIRKCAMKKEVINCACCTEYPCNIFISGRYNFAKLRIDEVRTKLAS